MYNGQNKLSLYTHCFSLKVLIAIFFVVVCLSFQFFFVCFLQIEFNILKNLGNEC